MQEPTWCQNIEVVGTMWSLVICPEVFNIQCCHTPTSFPDHLCSHRFSSPQFHKVVGLQWLKSTRWSHCKSSFEIQPLRPIYIVAKHETAFMGSICIFRICMKCINILAYKLWTLQTQWTNTIQPLSELQYWRTTAASGWSTSRPGAAVWTPRARAGLEEKRVNPYKCNPHCFLFCFVGCVEITIVNTCYDNHDIPPNPSQWGSGLWGLQAVKPPHQHGQGKSFLHSRCRDIKLFNHEPNASH